MVFSCHARWSHEPTCNAVTAAGRATIARLSHPDLPAPAVLVRSGSGCVVGYHQGRPEPELRRRRHQRAWPHQPAFRACRKAAAAAERSGRGFAWRKRIEPPHPGRQAPSGRHPGKSATRVVSAFRVLGGGRPRFRLCRAESENGWDRRTDVAAFGRSDAPTKRLLRGGSPRDDQRTRAARITPPTGSVGCSGCPRTRSAGNWSRSKPAWNCPPGRPTGR